MHLRAASKRVFKQATRLLIPSKAMSMITNVHESTLANAVSMKTDAN